VLSAPAALSLLAGLVGVATSAVERRPRLFSESRALGRFPAKVFVASHPNGNVRMRHALLAFIASNVAAASWVLSRPGIFFGLSAEGVCRHHDAGRERVPDKASTFILSCHTSRRRILVIVSVVVAGVAGLVGYVAWLARLTNPRVAEFEV